MIFYEGQSIFWGSVKHDSAVGYHYNPVAFVDHVMDVVCYNKCGQILFFVKSGYQGGDLSA